NELKCGEHEEILCLHSCPPVKTCHNLYVEVSCLTPTEPCENVCVCKDGRVRNAKNVCVPIDQCEPKCAGPNEVFTTCKKSCPPDICFSLVAKFSCDANELCQNGCVCKPGFLRKSLDSPCIPICQCPEMKYSPDCKNEVYSDCKQTCPPEICFSIVAFYDCYDKQDCEKGCACKPGYLRTEMNTCCVPLCQCPELVNAPECIATKTLN
ncbi:hypothetical protein HW555_014005, partial [Spodoptera exigua]